MAIQDSGSNYQFYDKNINTPVKRSVFDLSYLNTVTADAGQLIPVWWQLALPNSDYEISLDALIRVVNPPVVPLMSRQRVFFHTYFCSMSQLWSYWQTFISKGHSGKVALSLPILKFPFNGAIAGQPVFSRGSLLDYLGLGYISVDSGYIEVPLLKLMMYLQVYRDYYLNQNLESDSKMWFPDDESKFRLDSVSYDFNAGTSDVWSNGKPGSQGGYDELFRLRYRNWVDDYFTSALPWPMRGTPPSIELTAALPSTYQLNWTPSGGAPIPLKLSMFGPASDGDYSTLAYALTTSPQNVNLEKSVTNPGAGSARNSYLTGFYTGDGTGSFVSSAASPSGPKDGTLSVTLPGGTTISSNLTLDMLRNLNAAQIEMEKLARTNGSYFDFGKTFFDESSRDAQDFRPTYVGGTYQPIVITEVLQQSQSTDSSPQGFASGHGISSGSGYVGRLHTSDYGYFMTIMSIMPDAMYSQGRHRTDMYKTQEDFYLPTRAGLGPQGIYKGELYFSGNSTEDEKLFAYQDRYDELRYRSNEIHGKVADPTNLSFYPYTQARKFDSVPSFNNSFVSTKDTIRKDWLSAPNEVPYLVQVANRVRAVQPMPYKAIPEGLF